MSGFNRTLSLFQLSALIILFFGLSVITDSLIGQVPQNDMTSLAKIQDGVKSQRISSYDRSGGNNDRFENIEDGEIRTLAEIDGAGIINHIWITIAPTPNHLSRNDIILRMYWDGEEEPSVESPIGPFFGQGWEASYNYTSLPLAVGPKEGRALVSYFAMPFSEGAKITIENDTGRKISAFYYYIDYVEMDNLPDEYGRFHAWYNHELTEALPDGENEWGTLGETQENTTGDRNYLIADIEGKGHYVGVNYYVHNPGPIWYGEGDDMFFIDGEEWPPSLHGTGTEDYFNTSWCPSIIYTHPYFGYPKVNNNIGWLGRTHVYRFHINDPVYFDKSLRFSIEHGHNNALTLDLASVAYWYQEEPHKPFPDLPTRAERAPKDKTGPVEIHRWRHEWRKNNNSDPQLWNSDREN